MQRRSSAIPEEMLVLIMTHATQRVKDGTWTVDHPLYPVRSLEMYDQCATVQGVEGKGMSIRYGVVLRVEFVTTGKEQGDKANPTCNIYFKESRTSRVS